MIESVNRHWANTNQTATPWPIDLQPGQNIFEQLTHDPAMESLVSGLREFARAGSEDQPQDLVAADGLANVSAFRRSDGRRRLLLTVLPSTQNLRDPGSVSTQPSYQQVVEDQTEMICRFLPDMTLTFVNEACCQYFKHPAEELLQRPLLEFLPEDNHAFVLGELGQLTPDCPTRSYEHEVVRPDGAIAWEAWTDRAFFDAQGAVTEYQSVGRDITAHKQTETALRESETRFQQLADNLREVFWIFDWATRKLLYVSPAYEQVFGRSLQTLLDHADEWINAVHPEDQGRVTQAFRAASEGGFDESYRIFKPSGEQRWVRDRGYAVRDEAGTVVRIVGVTEDITERLSAEDRLRLSEERYRAAAEGGLDAFFLLDAVRDKTGQIIDFMFADLNQRGCDMVSRARDEVVGQKLCELLPVNRTDGFFDRYKKVVETQETLYDEFTISAREEGIKANWMAHQVIPVGDGVAISTRDISDRKQSEQEIIRQREESQNILDGIPAFVFYKDTENRILRVNRAVCEAMGLEASEIEGHHTAEFYPDQADAYYADDLAVIRSGKPKLDYVEEIVTDGELRFIRTDKVPLYGDQGRPKGVIAIATDVTQLKLTSESLRQSEKRYRELFDRVPVSVWEKDLTKIGAWLDELRERGITDIEAYLDEFPEEVEHSRKLVELKGVNQATHDLLGTADLTELIELHRRSDYGTPSEPWRLQLVTLWNGERSAEMQTYIYDVHGKKIDVLFRLEIPDNDGQPDLEQALTALTDMRANRQRMFAEAQVDQAARERKNLASELHDTLGQQLTGINMLAETLRRRIAPKSTEDAERVAELARMVGEANREVRRIISGLTPEPINPEQFEEALESIGEATELIHELPVSFICPGQPGELSSEKTNHLVLIAQEAVHNAAKHADANQIEIRLDTRDDGLVLTVRDDGTGLPGEFEKVGASDKGSGRGIGIMRFRCETIGATIDFESEQGRGTTVRCTLPSA